ncbi:MAG: fibronectin/fibrinogen-binding protein [Synechococcus sp. SB0668_bin_15]|nr:fibronectin/fibrinogen-binding protein [Synechococcus sp. SB0668_bin_15]MXZ82359.1 fibronectin/fibrinogen-binding protein [Synechococcus sp. SB0666_bin_14]MYC49454.1 fibronectin/fibrinogen-binding protein [Synechococcus sp. SB0662_bin_14]MYG46940.1 fibronectin/fibrinogen-binding protein [Synechococcus sp. SB0675_bin_6]MYJ60107.1 fibronectin/fibrinogen-binding protein [Synechococcus sp. SB0672_bin_6]MYK90697.1 fibronectin/fibrinogen-binding protein [Synechococcus sp. SB0669_bin_8]
MTGSGVGIPVQQQDFTTLCAVCHELDQQVVPSRFVKAQQTDGTTIHMGLRTVSTQRWLELSWFAEAPRFYPCLPPPRQGAGSTLAQQLHHGLRGLALTALRQPPWERIVQLEFGKRPGAVVERRLVLELMGRHSNLFLLDAGDRIMAMGRQVKPHQSRVRPLGCGDHYSAPPPAPGRVPDGQESCTSWQKHLQLAPLPLAKALWQRYGGISPSLARQLCDGAGIDATICVTTLTKAQWQHLHQQWQTWLAALETRRFRFQVEGDQSYRLWPVPPAAQGSCQSTDLPGPGDGPHQSLGLALAAFHGRRLRHGRLQRDRQRLVQVLRKAMAGEQRLRDDVQHRLAAVADHTTLQRRADRLMCCPDLQRSGLTTLLAADPMGGPEESISLDPEITVLANAQRLYQKARKLRRSRQVLEPRLERHRQRLARLESAHDQFLLHWSGAPPDQHQALLEELEDELRELELMRCRSAASPAGTPPSRPLQLHSPGGLRLLVGRNNRQNDRISIQEARPGDLWFHAQEIPGSHVVLKVSEATGADEKDVQTAADLAAYFSRGRGSGAVAVVSTATHHLQRIPGAGPGVVRFRGSRVLWGHPDAAASLLRSQGP